MGDFGNIVHRQYDKHLNKTIRFEYSIYKMLIRIRGEHKIIGYYQDVSMFKSLNDFRARAKDTLKDFQIEIEFYSFDQNNNEAIISLMVE